MSKISKIFSRLLATLTSSASMGKLVSAVSRRKVSRPGERFKIIFWGQFLLLAMAHLTNLGGSITLTSGRRTQNQQPDLHPLGLLPLLNHLAAI